MRVCSIICISSTMAMPFKRLIIADFWNLQLHRTCDIECNIPIERGECVTQTISIRSIKPHATKPFTKHIRNVNRHKWLQIGFQFYRFDMETFQRTPHSRAIQFSIRFFNSHSFVFGKWLMGRCWRCHDEWRMRAQKRVCVCERERNRDQVRHSISFQMPFNS